MTSLQSALEPMILAYLLNSIWQAPLVFCAAWVAARLARQAGPQLEHRIWVGALMLEVFLPLCSLQLGELWQRAWGLALWFRHPGAAGGETRVILGAGTASPVALPWLTTWVLSAAAVAYLCSLLYIAARLAWGVWTTESLRLRAEPMVISQTTALKMQRLMNLLGSRKSTVHFADSAAISGPATVGVRRPTVLFPAGFLNRLSADDLDALLAHEAAHISRFDFAKNLLYGIVSLPAAYHPVVWLTRARLAESREIVCDALAADVVGGREVYARSLLRLVSMLSVQPAPRILHAIGILDANIFERRVMNLTRKSPKINRARRITTVAACILVALATCTSALALRMNVTEPSAETSTTPKVHVKVGDLTIVNKIPPDYPVEAKKDRLSGTVILSAVIGKDGAVERIDVTKSLRTDCDQSAIDAVRQWRYKPFLVNGEPTEVETTIHIIFTLAK